MLQMQLSPSCIWNESEFMDLHGLFGVCIYLCIIVEGTYCVSLWAKASAQ